MKELFRWLLKRKLQLFAGIIILLVVDLFQLIIPLVLRKLINLLELGKATSQDIVKFSFYVLALALLTAIFRFFWRLLIVGNARKIEEELRNAIYQHIIYLSPSFFNKYTTGDIMARATNDIDAIRMASIMGIVGTFDTIYYGTFSIVAMLKLSTKLALYILIPLPLLAITIFIFSKLIYRYFQQVQAAFSAITESVRESVAGIRVIKGYAQERGATEEFAHTNKDYLKKNMKLVRVYGGFQPIINFFASFSLFLILWLGGRKTILGEMQLGDLVAFSSYMGMLIWPMIAIGWVTNVIQRGAASMERIQKLLKEMPEVKEPKRPVNPDIKGNIHVKNLNFAYIDKKYVLKNITLKIREGSRIGIIGKTGSGKTTLIKLLLKLYNPPPNTIFYEGTPIEKIHSEHLRKFIGIVPQESVLFTDTIKNNICFGLKENECSMEKVIEAARIAEIHDEIMNFPRGYETVVGERGVTLSGGQKQRIAIARAIIKKPRIIIFDDALSAVDARTERRILENLKHFLKGRTSIIISQRIVALKDADYIYVMQDGKIQDEGTHRELIQRDGLYRTIYELQRITEKETI